MDVGTIILWFVVFLFSLSFHEAAHAWTSEKFGDDTGRLQGRITLNPIPHIDPIGTIAFPLISAFTSIPLFGWAKPVDVNPNLWRDKKTANISVSAAGPISNFILAIIAFTVIKVLFATGILMQNPDFGGLYQLIIPTPGQPAFMVPLAMALLIMVIVNIALGVFNLIPIPPLDGSGVLESLLPDEMAAAYEQIRPYGFFLLFALMLLGVFSFILNPILLFVLRLLLA